MAGDAYDTIKKFWDIQDAGDYTATAALFAEDALFVDPVFGTFASRDEIAAFMAKMNVAVAEQNGVFTLVELAGGDDSAWAQWHFSSDRGDRDGVGVYRVRDGEITYYRDYMNEAAPGAASS